MISVGEGRGTNKVDDVVNNTPKNKPLDTDYENAMGVLLHITSGNDLTPGEVNEIGSRMQGI